VDLCEFETSLWSSQKIPGHSGITSETPFSEKKKKKYSSHGHSAVHDTAVIMSDSVTALCIDWALQSFYRVLFLLKRKPTDDRLYLR